MRDLDTLSAGFQTEFRLNLRQWTLYLSYAQRLS
jgi:hypothetical protein